MEEKLDEKAPDVLNEALVMFLKRLVASSLMYNSADGVDAATNLREHAIALVFIGRDLAWSFGLDPGEVCEDVEQIEYRLATDHAARLLEMLGGATFADQGPGYNMRVTLPEPEEAPEPNADGSYPCSLPFCPVCGDEG